MSEGRQMPLLPGQEAAPERPVRLASLDVVRILGSKSEALRKCCELSGLDQDHIARSLGLDPSHFSRMLKPTADSRRYFPQDLEAQLLKLTGCALPVQWTALQIGCGLAPLESELEHENRQLREELDIARAEHAAVVRFLRQTRGAE
jgi:hypothetical protein